VPVSGRAAAWLGAGLCLLLWTPAGCSHSAAHGRRIIVLGIDGMDPGFLERHWASLPNLDRLRREGEYKRLQTTMPPQSPVAWSTFITGMDPGGHGIYDFVHRNPRTLAPYSSLGQTAEGGRSLPLGPYLLPLSRGHVIQFRKGEPFWKLLAAQHIPTTILRMPTNFPPLACADDRALAGMGTPDLRGTFGTFTFYTDDARQQTREVPGGRIVAVSLENHRVTLRVEGPRNSLRKDQAPTFVEMRVAVDPAAPAARFETGGAAFILKQGEWSEWVRVKFPLIPGLSSAAGMFRVYARRLQPNFEVYVSPVNIDPEDPALPISYPASYSRELARAVGPFYTQGMAQDTAALRQGVFDRAEYRAQSRAVSLSGLRVLRYGLQHFGDGLLFFHFFGVDQDSHMLWGKYEDELLETYRLVDQALGWVRERAGGATLVVMSDHGFASFDRAVHLNTWLMQEGFLALDDPRNTGSEELFAHVDWSRTQAYSLGLNGIYLNLEGREREGSVPPGAEAEAVLAHLARRLAEFRDPETGKPVVASIVLPRKEFHGGALENAPDLIVGYMPGYRSSWQTALGAVPAALIEDNTDEWRGDHCIDARFVPGVLISNRKSRLAAPHLYDLTVSLLAEFGVAPDPGMIGRSIY